MMNHTSQRIDQLTWLKGYWHSLTGLFNAALKTGKNFAIFLPAGETGAQKTPFLFFPLFKQKVFFMYPSVRERWMHCATIHATEMLYPALKYTVIYDLGIWKKTAVTACISRLKNIG